MEGGLAADWLVLKHPVHWPVLRSLVSRGLLFPAVLVAAVAAILVHGALDHTGAGIADADVAPESPAPSPIPGLRPDLEKAPLSYVSEYWLQLGTLARKRLVAIGTERHPAAVFAPGLAVASAYAVSVPSVPDRGPGSDPELLGIEPEAGLAFYRLPEPTAPAFVPAGAESLRAAAWIASVSFGADGRLELAPAQVHSAPGGASPAERARLDLFPSPPGSRRLAALVDLDGRLVAVSAQWEGERRQVPASELVSIAERLRMGVRCRALEVAEVTGDAGRLLGIRNGVLVRRIVTPAFGDDPGLRPGDVLLRWNGKPVGDPEEFGRLYDGESEGSRIDALALRHGRTVAVRLLMPGSGCRPYRAPHESWAALGLTLRREEGGEPPGWTVLSTAPKSRAARAGVAAGDLVVAVQGRPPGGAGQGPPRLGPGPVLLTVSRAGRVDLVVVPAEL